jgi:hypothetical protein
MIDTQLRETRAPLTPTTLRQFATLWLLVFGALGVAQIVRHHQGRGVVFTIVALGVGLSGLIRPALVRPVFNGAVAAALPIGAVVSRLLLGAVFYGVFTPMAFLFRVAGRDVLHRRRRPAVKSYWTAKSQPSDPTSYLQQS